MKKLFSINYSQSLAHSWLLLLRICVSAFMLTHGLPKFLKVLGGNFQFADPLGIGTEASLILAVFAEFFCSLFIILGLGTRLFSIPLIITMLVAAFIAHSDDPFARKEMALLYLLIYITLLVFGSGKYSLDALINKSRKKYMYK
ncbi:MAG: DoxX family protein [Cytophagaceae bacterium]